MPLSPKIKSLDMKKVFLLVLFAGTLNFSHAQMHFPFPSDNPYWIEQHGGLWSCSTMGQHGDCSGYYCQCDMPVYYKSDTIINNIAYNQLFTRGICMAFYVQGAPPEGCPNGFSFSNPETLFAVIRQDTIENKVFIRINESDELLFDFNSMIVGSDYPKTYTNILNDTVVVVSLETSIISSKEIKTWQLGIRQNGVIHSVGFASITEGIGSSLGLLGNLIIPFENTDRLLCFSLNNEVIFPDSTTICDKTLNIGENIQKQLFTLFPNPASDFLFVETTQNSGMPYFYTIYNSIGIEVLKTESQTTKTRINIETLPTGIYIIRWSNNKIMLAHRFIKR